MKSHQRYVKSSHLERNLEDADDDDEVLQNGFATPPLQLSPTRSHSRLHMASYKVRCLPTLQQNLLYLPRTELIDAVKNTVKTVVL